MDIGKFVSKSKDYGEFPFSLKDFLLWVFTNQDNDKGKIIAGNLTVKFKHTTVPRQGKTKYMITFTTPRRTITVDETVENNLRKRKAAVDDIIENKTGLDSIENQYFHPEIHSISHDFDEQAVKAMRSLADNVLKKSPYNPTKVDYYFKYGKKISVAYMKYDFFNILNKDEFLAIVNSKNKNIVADTVKKAFGSYEEDLKDYIILFDNRVDARYRLHYKSDNSRIQFDGTATLFFGVYPARFYYAEGGIGYYKLRLKALCKKAIYSDSELRKWYREILPRGQATDTRVICEIVSKWVNDLSTENYENVKQLPVEYRGPLLQTYTLKKRYSNDEPSSDSDND